MRRAAPTLLLAVTILASCQQAPPPPPLGDSDLRRAMLETMGVPVTPFMTRTYLATPDPCTDLHRGGTTMDDSPVHLDGWDKAAMRFGLSKRFRGWHMPGADDEKPVAAALDQRLANAASRVALRVAGQPARSAKDKPWPPQCETRQWLEDPVYEGEFAFVDQGSSCGGLCGTGSLIALEFRDGRWHVIAILPTWQA